jgi:hypothetical protein
MTGEAEDEFPEALLPLLEIADEKQKIELTKELLDFAAKAFAAHNRRLDEAMISGALKPIFSSREKNMIKTIFEEKYDEGVAEGKAEREARGESRGQAKTVLTFLRARFKSVPKSVEKAILAISDSIALESWAAQAATCQSMDEFAEALK